MVIKRKKKKSKNCYKIKKYIKKTHNKIKDQTNCADNFLL